MREMSLAFLAKSGWRFLTESGKLWTKILHEKYVKGRIEIPKLQKKKITSNAWRGMAATQETIKKGLRVSVYNGAETLFWRDIWLGTRNKISVIMDISVLRFYRNIGNIGKYRWIF